MALITCTECGKQLSDKAYSCPNCGCPISIILESREILNIFGTTEGRLMSITNFRNTLIQICDKRKPISISHHEPNPVIVNIVSSKNDACCPRCGSSQIAAKTKGFGLGKAVVGGFLLGPIGLLGGTIGSNKTLVVCLKCGHQWGR